ncbi:ferrochelatase-2, chloroplastic, partial [Gossypium hirsutum]|uniref:Ferrochelatase n=1 Tax=Gossypium hirsutum TaxID=3635 RepID=A0ABM3BP96_GOSHI
SLFIFISSFTFYFLRFLVFISGFIFYFPPKRRGHDNCPDTNLVKKQTIFSNFSLCGIDPTPYTALICKLGVGLYWWNRQPSLISILLAPKTKQRYAAIGGGSPLRRITEEQADALRTALEAKNLHANVYVGMRYWYPFMEEAIQQIKRDRIMKLVVLPLFPQFSITTTGSSIRVLQRIFMDNAYLSRLPVSIIRFWYRRQGYIRSIADSIVTQLSKFEKPEEVLIFFSAHGVPVSYVENAGDPYKNQIEECIYLIMRELKARGARNDHTLAYQSRVGPVQWPKPYTNEVLVELGWKGVKSLLAVPISYVSEHIETLEEIDMGYKDLALKSGIKNWGRVPALGCTSSFITDLADAVVEALPSAKALSILRETAKESDCR